jgi:hypothetical protein
MDLYFASAEQTPNLLLLESLGVKHVAISYYEWERRHASNQGIEMLRKFIPEQFSIVLTPGIAKKEGLDYPAFARSYVEFCERNAEDALIYDLDSQDCPLQIRREARKHLTFFPNIVVFPMEDESHLSLAGTYERIGVNANAAKSIPAAELRRLPATLYGSNITNPKVLSGGRFAATTSMAWLSGRRYGELWLFLRGQLRHFKADQLQRAVRAYSDDISAIGGDPEACAAADKEALTMVGVKSLLLMADSLSGRLRDRVNPQTTVVTQKGVTLAEAADSGTRADASTQIVPASRTTIPLPVLHGDQANHDSLRRCDSCDLAPVCPRYSAGATCAFNIPLEIKTDADWESACQVILEWQFGRIAFSVFAEQVNGGTPLPKTGQEMDRFTKLLTSVKELKKPDPSAGGILSEILSGLTPPIMEDHNGNTEEIEDAEVEEEAGAESE